MKRTSNVKLPKCLPSLQKASQSLYWFSLQSTLSHTTAGYDKRRRRSAAAKAEQAPELRQEHLLIFWNWSKRGWGHQDPDSIGCGFRLFCLFFACLSTRNTSKETCFPQHTKTPVFLLGGTAEQPPDLPTLKPEVEKLYSVPVWARGACCSEREGKQTRRSMLALFISLIKNMLIVGF